MIIHNKREYVNILGIFIQSVTLQKQTISSKYITIYYNIRKNDIFMYSNGHTFLKTFKNTQNNTWFNIHIWKTVFIIQHRCKKVPNAGELLYLVLKKNRAPSETTQRGCKHLDIFK